MEKSTSLLDEILSKTKCIVLEDGLLRQNFVLISILLLQTSMPSLSRSSSDLISFVLLLFYNRCLPKTFEDDNDLIKFYVSVWNLKKDFLSRHYSSMTNLLNEWQIIMYIVTSP